MEKLKIFGKKEGFKGFIASIYVKDGKLVVEAEDPEVKKDLEKALKEATLDEEYTIGVRRGAVEKRDDGTEAYITYLTEIKPGDSGYLLGLSSRPVFCYEDTLSDPPKKRRVGDYEMGCGLSRVIDFPEDKAKEREEELRWEKKSSTNIKKNRRREKD